MNESHVISLGVAKELAAKGIDFPESEKVWVKRKIGFGEYSGWELLNRTQAIHKAARRTWGMGGDRALPAFSLSELLDRLPNWYIIIKGAKLFYCTQYFSGEFICQETFKTYDGVVGQEAEEANTAPDAAAKMLIKLERSHDKRS